MRCLALAKHLLIYEDLTDLCKQGLAERKLYNMDSFFKAVDKIKPVYDVTYKVMLFICKVLLVADILITSMSVLGRYVPFIPDPSWSEEVVLTLMSYMAVLSAALAIRRGAHIRMTALDRYLPKTLVKILDLLNDVFVLGLALVMIIVGWKYATTIGSKGTYVSGGEAQRIKLATELSKVSTGKTLYILDEPTTGLHIADVNKLIEILQRLTDNGNTVLVIEHNLDLIKTCDYIIDLGPEGGDAGGEVIAVGSPEKICKNKDSYTGQFLAKYLK